MKSYKRTIFTISSLLTGILTILFYINPNIKNNPLYMNPDECTHYYISGLFLVITIILIVLEDYILFKRIRNIK